MRRFMLLLLALALLSPASLAQGPSESAGASSGTVRRAPTDNPAASAAVVTKEALQKRLGQLQQLHDRTLADLNAMRGAIEECQYEIAQAEEAEKAAATKNLPAKPKGEEPKKEAPQKK